MNFPKTFPNGCGYYNSCGKAIEVSISAKKFAYHLVVMYDFEGIGCSCSSKKEIKTNNIQ